MTPTPLVELDPRWTSTSDDRHGMGVSFNCPHCRVQRLAIWFANPLDGGPPAPGERHWQRSGDTFATLSLTPSIDASGWGHWHGFLSNGVET
jgi:hypothetical protein